MYTASTYERPARRHVAVLLAAAALVVTLAGAWELRRARFAPVPLEPSVQLPGWPFTFRPPKGFTPADDLPDEPPRNPWAGEVLYGMRDRQGRSLELVIGFRTYSIGTIPRQAAAQFLLDHKIPVTADDEPSIRPQPVAGLFGEAIELAGATQGGPRFYRAAAACLPTGQTVAVLLRGVGAPAASDLNVFRSVCEGAKLHAAHFAPNLDDLARRIGLTCDPLPNAFVLAQADRPAPFISLTASPAAPFGWHIEVLPTFLAGGRTVEALMHDRLVNDQGVMRPRTKVDVTTRDGRHTARVAEAPNGNAIDVRFIDLGERRAALLLGYTHPETLPDLAKLCDQVAASLRVDPAAWPYKVESAEQNAAQLLTRINRQGISSIAKQYKEPVYWLSESAGSAMQRETIHWKSDSAARGRLSGECRLVEGDARRPGLSLLRRWTIDAAGRAFRSTEDITWRREARAIKIRTKLDRETPEGPLTYEVTFDGDVYQNQFDAPPNYVPDPIIDPVIGQFAAQPADAGALFHMVTLSDKSLVCIYLRSLPSAPHADDELPPIAQNADYAPRPIIRWFDAQGRLAREQSAFALTTRRIPSDEDTQELP